MNQMPVSIIEMLGTGVEASITRGCLQPLIKSIELAFAYSRDNISNASSTIFSCDSFCQPHLETQIAFFKALKRSKQEISFCNFPISHYISSIPDHRLLELASHPSRLIDANQELLTHQSEFNENVSPHDVTSLISEEIKIFSSNFESLTRSFEDKIWHECFINDFPFHELAFRDLSLTYKCTPELTRKDPLYFHVYSQGIKFNLWLLCLLLCQQEIGKTGICMSFYSASTVFQFFCAQTNRVFRFIDSPQDWIESFGLQKSQYIRLLSSPTANTELTRKDITTQLNAISLSDQALTTIDNIINYRFKGIGSHTYSFGLDDDSDSRVKLGQWIQHQKDLGKKITSLFTSSPDELIGQQLSYNQFQTDLSHLERSIFSNQENWIDQTIEYYSKLSDNSPLIIRFHPRLAADKRGLSESPYFSSIWSVFSDKCKGIDNIQLVHPADKVSSYWLGLESDLILNGWSTIGLEFAIKNKIVTNAFYNCTLGGGAVYPVHLNSPQLRSTTQYFARVARLLNSINNDKAIDSRDVVSADEARKAFFAVFTCGLINLNDISKIRAQMAMPSVLTSHMIDLLL